ncbi:hypothetical protein K439DRAFT_1626090 [Ramaria rubella]|nr:hypothetical protein K439DRAFT_1626090 [Ramaria rubella]
MVPWKTLDPSVLLFPFHIRLITIHLRNCDSHAHALHITRSSIVSPNHHKTTTMFTLAFQLTHTVPALLIASRKAPAVYRTNSPSRANSSGRPTSPISHFTPVPKHNIRSNIFRTTASASLRACLRRDSEVKATVRECLMSTAGPTPFQVEGRMPARVEVL